MRKQSKNEKSQNEQYYQALRQEVWQKAIGNNVINRKSHYYEQIKKKISQNTGFLLSKDTIRNFLESKHVPQVKTLDIYSTYVLDGNSDMPKTFQDFQNWYHNKSIFRKAKEILLNNRKKSLYIISILLTIMLFCGIVLRRQSFKNSLNQGNKVSHLNVTFNSSNDTINKVIDYYKVFKNSNLSELRKAGWFLFPDYINLAIWDKEEYKNNGYLTLETHLGGPWLENDNYSPRTANILAHPIQCADCCEIKVKLVGFNPYQRYQQAGFFLFYSDTEIPSIYYTFSCGGNNNHIQAVYRDGEYSNTDLIPFSRYQYRSRISRVSVPKTQDSPSPEILVDSMVFKLIVKDDHYFFQYKTDQNSYVPVASKKILLDKPKYIGLAAFQGRPDVPQPIYDTADIIPAKFEYVHISACTERN